MNLYEYLRDPRNSVGRERLLHLRAIYDLKFSAACSGLSIQITEPEIDNSGHDFSIVSGFDHLFIQNKTVLSDAETSGWSIHSNLLSPAWYDRDIAPTVGGEHFRSTMSLEGGGGCVLVHEVDAVAAQDNRLVVRYFFLDVYFLKAIESGLHASETTNASVARRILLELTSASRVTIARKLFLEVSRPAAIIGFRWGIPDPLNYIPGLNSFLKCKETGTDSHTFERQWKNSIAQFQPWTLFNGN